MSEEYDFAEEDELLSELIKDITQHIDQGKLIITGSHSIKEKIMALEAMMMHIEMMHGWEHENLASFFEEIAEEFNSLREFLDKGKKEFTDLVVLEQAIKKRGKSWILHHKKITIKDEEKFKQISKRTVNKLKEHIAKIKNLISESKILIQKEEDFDAENEVYRALNSALKLIVSYETLFENS
jgi:hypothetical protein